MDRTTLEQRLREAKTQVALGVEHIVRQRGFLARLEQRGSNTFAAWENLRTLLNQQSQHLADVERLTGELRRQSS